MEPIVDQFRRELDGITPRQAEYPLFSTVLGREVSGPELDADYWAEQIISPVRFFDAIQAALRSTAPDYLAEAGPKWTLLALARHGDLPSHTDSLPLCTGPNSDGTELLAVADSMMHEGYSPDLAPLYGTSPGPVHRLPPYVFDDSRRFWSDGPHAYQAGGNGTRPRQDTQHVSAELPTPPAEQSPSGWAPDGAHAGILAIIADVGGYQVGALTRSKRLADDLGYDSLLQLRLLDRLRAEYPQLRDVTVEEVLPKIYSVGDLVDFAVQRLQQREAVT